ncbi:SMI1/KNR4 family protein [uncultured Tenacibaculum sp.]|uniref:SMI1/KNR4 family protein n=1 Tax=uncultured Tenacibaculum sp. TaxID=174713 RepID=UPI0026070368|nr:SMI1/KNR4 family protein [uncultured Tenacibaculum sp.]
MFEINKIISHYKKSGIKLNKGIEVANINTLEKKLKFIFPNSFKEFYKAINGFSDFDMDDNMFTIYSIERIEEEFKASKNAEFIPFSDYLINSHQIGFRKSDGHVYINYSLENHINTKVALTFEQSLLEIINNTDKVY